jgi:hypothetical protein
MSDAATVDDPALLFNPLSADFNRNPYVAYHELRRRQPLARHPLGFWLASRHEDVADVLKDRRFGKDYKGQMTRRMGPDVMKDLAIATVAKTMLVANPPDHTRMRGIVAKAFTARRVEAMRPRIRLLVDQLLDAVEDKGEMDVVADFAHPLPTSVICDMLGIPEADRAQFLETSNRAGRVIDPTPLSRAEMDEANANFEGLHDYFNTLIAARRAAPEEDLVTVLVTATDEDGKLTDEELIANIILLFGAGHETTVNLISNGLLALHLHPEELEKLKRDPSLMPNAVEELLRYDSSVQMTTRVANEDLEFAGTAIQKGEIIVAMLGAANRDPEAFGDPDGLDVARPGVRSVSFGGGIHHCLGAQLARIEAEIALSTLLSRLPGLTLTGLDEPQWRPTFTLRGLERLPASW